MLRISQRQQLTYRKRRLALGRQQRLSGNQPGYRGERTRECSLKKRQNLPVRNQNASAMSSSVPPTHSAAMSTAVSTTGFPTTVLESFASSMMKSSTPPEEPGKMRKQFPCGRLPVNCWEPMRLLGMRAGRDKHALSSFMITRVFSCTAMAPGNGPTHFQVPIMIGCRLFFGTTPEYRLNS